MKEILQNLALAAKANLMKDGHLATVMMWFKDKKLIGSPQLFVDFKEPTTDENKDMNVLAAGMFAKEIGADSVVFIWDGAMKTMNPDQPYDITESPLSYPESMRTECILIEAIKMPSGKEDVIIIPYKGGDGKPVEFLPEDAYKGMDHFKSRISEIVVRGYSLSV